MEKEKNAEMSDIQQFVSGLCAVLSQTCRQLEKERESNEPLKALDEIDRFLWDCEEVNFAHGDTDFFLYSISAFLDEVKYNLTDDMELLHDTALTILREFSTKIQDALREIGVCLEQEKMMSLQRSIKRSGLHT